MISVSGRWSELNQSTSVIPPSPSPRCGAGASSEHDADEVDGPTVREAVGLRFRVAQHGDDAVEFNLVAEFLEAVSTCAVGERFARFESAAGQTPGSIVAAASEEYPSLVVDDGDACCRHRLG